MSTLDEKLTGSTATKLKDELGKLKGFTGLSDDDWNKMGAYFKERGATSVVFAPNVIKTFVKFVQDNGVPFTKGAADMGGLNTPRYNTDTMLNILVHANILDYVVIPGNQAKDVKRSDAEDRQIRKNPRMKLKVYELDHEFQKDFLKIMRDAGIVESQNLRYIQIGDRVMGHPWGEVKEDLEDLKNRIRSMSEAEPRHGHDEDERQKVDEPNERDLLRKLTDDHLDHFVDQMLLGLGELEASGEIPEITSPEMARDAILAILRKMYSRRGLIARMSKKYLRYGNARAFRKGGAEIRKAASQERR